MFSSLIWSRLLPLPITGFLVDLLCIIPWLLWLCPPCCFFVTLRSPLMLFYVVKSKLRLTTGLFLVSQCFWIVPVLLLLLLFFLVYDHGLSLFSSVCLCLDPRGVCMLQTKHKASLRNSVLPHLNARPSDKFSIIACSPQSALESLNQTRWFPTLYDTLIYKYGEKNVRELRVVS